MAFDLLGECDRILEARRYMKPRLSTLVHGERDLIPVSPSAHQPTSHSPPILKLSVACPPETFRYRASESFARPFRKIRRRLPACVFAGGGHTAPNRWKHGRQCQNNAAHREGYRDGSNNRWTKLGLPVRCVSSLNTHHNRNNIVEQTVDTGSVTEKTPLSESSSGLYR